MFDIAANMKSILQMLLILEMLGDKDVQLQ